MLHKKAKACIQSLKQQLKSQQQNHERFLNAKFLNGDQKRALTRASKESVWLEKAIRTALQIKHVCGTSGYEHVRSSSFSLSSNRTLVQRFQNIHFLPGVLHEVFKFQVKFISNTGVGGP